MKLLFVEWGGVKYNSFSVKKLLLCLILICCAVAVFAQSVYEVDLNKLPDVSYDKGVTYDKTTKTLRIKERDKGFGIWTGDLNISNYNIVRIKYKVLGNYGFQVYLNYDDEKLEYYEKGTYFPTYLNEMVIPLLSNQKKINDIFIKGTWDVPYEQLNEKIVIESITFEKVANPVKTDIYRSNEPPVIDAAKSTSIDEKLDAWDFVNELGAGVNWQIFQDGPSLWDYGLDLKADNLSKPTKEQIHFMKAKGFNLIRLQTNPGLGRIIDKNYKLAPGYIRNIKQVVDWCIEEGMYVILCGPFSEFTPFEEYKKRMEMGATNYAADYVNKNNKNESEKYIKAVWEQFAQAFNNSYDEHLIFETLNEPADMLHEHGWWPEDNCAECKKDYAILNEYNQLIVDTIRATGGNNANRFIMVEGLAGKWMYITSNLFKMPNDKAKNKLIPTYHHYPMGGGKDSAIGLYTDGVRTQIKESFNALDTKFFSKHIPVYVSEVSNIRSSPIMERINCIKDFMAEVSKPERSCAACFFIDSDITGTSNFFGYYDSWKLKWYDQEYIDTFIYRAQGKDYPLSADFVKKNEVKKESIIGKNLLKEPIAGTGNWYDNYKIRSDTFYRSTPAKYKIEFKIERTGSNPLLRLAYVDLRGKFHNTNTLKNLKVKGGLLEFDIKVQSDTVILSIDEKLAKEFVDGEALFLNGNDIIIKSMKVVE